MSLLLVKHLVFRVPCSTVKDSFCDSWCVLNISDNAALFSVSMALFMFHVPLGAYVPSALGL